MQADPAANKARKEAELAAVHTVVRTRLQLIHNLMYHTHTHTHTRDLGDTIEYTEFAFLFLIFFQILLARVFLQQLPTTTTNNNNITFYILQLQPRSPWDITIITITI